MILMIYYAPILTTTYSVLKIRPIPVHEPNDVFDNLDKQYFGIPMGFIVCVLEVDS